MEKWLILGLSGVKYKISLEHYGVPESKEMLKKQKDEGMSDTGANGQSWKKLSDNIDRVVWIIVQDIKYIGVHSDRNK